MAFLKNFAMALVDKTAAPAAPGLWSRISAAANKIYSKVDTPVRAALRKADTPVWGQTSPRPDMPRLRQVFSDPKGWAKGVAKGYGSHLKTLSTPSGLMGAMKDVSPIALGLTLLPELTGQGIIHSVSEAPEGEKLKSLASGLGGLVGGQLMWPTGIVGSLGGSYLGSAIGERMSEPFSSKKDRRTQIYPGISPPMMHASMFPDANELGPKVGIQHLPEVSGTSPSLSLGGPGREDVGSRGRVSNRNNEYFGADSLRSMGSSGLDQIFHAGQGLGSGGGQPYADDSIFLHLKLDPGGKVRPKSNRELGDSSLDSASSDYL